MDQTSEILSEFNESISHLFPAHDYSTQSLKPDHALRPIHCLKDGRILLESFTNIESALDFVISIAEPITRPQHLHE
jgi:DNA excision repair protein ERCC-3